MSSLFTNQLINETSPYLLQHAHNPVDWYPWGAEALQRAKDENKVILVSIGYAACHWCHVMERESFENEATAQLMNEHFINIKIDREERPDLDHIYMDAVQAMTGSGGWPLNVFLTPDTKPFYGGTYFPPVKAFNRSSWPEVLQGVTQAWQERSHEIVAQAENMVAYLQQSNNIGQKQNPGEAGKNPFSAEQCTAIFQQIMKSADKEWGGFGKAPKFPQTFTIQYLLQYHHFTGNQEALQQVLLSLDKMLEGGIYDHVGGGLARYSTDREWLAPHFEKMLYDNALLLLTLCDAYQLTRYERYEKAIRKTISFVQEELMNEQGGFYAALDADSEGVEGKYYIWQKEAIEAILGEEAALFCDYFDVKAEGNWEGETILRILQPAELFIKERNLDKNYFEEKINSALALLKKERSKRIKPLLDDKVLLGWNALMLQAISKAASVFNDEGYRQIALKNFLFITAAFEETPGSAALRHSYKNGIAKYPAFLDDYACLITAAINLYEVTFDTACLEKARDWCSYVVENFTDEENIFFFFTNKAQTDIVVRKKEIYDGATPSGNAVMAMNLYKLAVIFDRADWRTRSLQMLEGLSPMITKYPTSFGVWAGFFLQNWVGLNEIAVVGRKFAEIDRQISQEFIPNKVKMCSGEKNNGFPMLADRFLDGKTLAYLCRDFSCLPPFTTAEELLFTIRANDKIIK